MLISAHFNHISMYNNVRHFYLIESEEHSD